MLVDYIASSARNLTMVNLLSIFRSPACGIVLTRYVALTKYRGVFALSRRAQDLGWAATPVIPTVWQRGIQTISWVGIDGTTLPVVFLSDGMIQLSKVWDSVIKTFMLSMIIARRSATSTVAEATIDLRAIWIVIPVKTTTLESARTDTRSSLCEGLIVRASGLHGVVIVVEIDASAACRGRNSALLATSEGYSWHRVVGVGRDDLVKHLLG
jgi:hypothetical protein